jgi:PIN domain nuclease of toxin-antitoxin system
LVKRLQDFSEEAFAVIHAVIYLDTHVVHILADAKPTRLSREAQQSIARATDIRISPIVLVELEYLWEIGRVRGGGKAALATLTESIGLRVCDLPFEVIARHAAFESWTRDVFDRVITAHAKAAKAVLITRDLDIQANYKKAVG